MPEVGGHPQDPEHVRSGRTRRPRRATDLLAQDRGDRAQRLERVSGRRPRPRIRSAGTPWSMAYARATAASVVRSPGGLPPVTTNAVGDRRVGTASTAWSRRAANTGDGRPSYWAAPRTTIASAGRLLVAVALLPDPEGRVARRRTRRSARPATMMRPRSRITRRRSASRVSARGTSCTSGPEPHQHGSLRPIRAPDGVKPGRSAARPPAAARRRRPRRRATRGRRGRRAPLGTPRATRRRGDRRRRRRWRRRPLPARGRRSGRAPSPRPSPRAGRAAAGRAGCRGRRRRSARLARDRDPEDRAWRPGGG